MGGILPQYVASQSTYGVKPPPAPVASVFARPPQTTAPTTTFTSGSTATRVGAPTTGVAGGVTRTVGGVSASTYGRPAPAPPPAPAPSTGLTTTPYHSPYADDGSGAKRQADAQAAMDARTSATRDLSMQQQPMGQPQQQDQGGGGYGGYGGYDPMPIPIAPGEAPSTEPQTAAAGQGPTMMAPAQTPDVGTGWGDFAARPAGPPNLGLSRQSMPMQQLRATRANGGLY